MTKNLLEKLKESLQAVLPIGVICLLLHFTVAPMPGGTVALMLTGMVLLIIGLTLFSLGTDIAMMPMGEHIGSALLRSKNLLLMVVALFIFGTLITIAEPDLQVLATQVAAIDPTMLIIGVSAGVGLFLVIATLRVLFRWPLARVLMILYPLVFILAIFSKDYLAVAFDASAVTTGPITVPFLLAIGAGFAATTSSGSDDDNFGICAICSIGPVLAVLLLGLFSGGGDANVAEEAAIAVSGAAELIRIFAKGLVHTFLEVVVILVPIVVIFGIFQITKLKLSKAELYKIGFGLVYILFGLTIFLTGVNYGFMPAAKYLGEAMGALEYNWILIPLCVVIGACVVLAEPAVHVLTKQVEEITNGAISGGMMLFGMAVGVGIAMSLAMVRVLFGISIWFILIPGYLIALGLTFFVPKIFVGVGFDSGGVAAGAMSASFVLPFTIGVCSAAGGDILTGAFGVVGMIAMMPPITVQVMGVIYNIKLKRARRLQTAADEAAAAEQEI